MAHSSSYFVSDARDARTPHVAFSAFLDHRQTHVQIDDIIHFNKVLINEGDSFNVDTGKKN